ncbi:TPA: hypothetical protein ACF3TT_002566 [Enterococcus faecium]
MKLLDQILSNQNMNEAYKRVYRNKGVSGVNGITVEELKSILSSGTQRRTSFSNSLT